MDGRTREYLEGRFGDYYRSTDVPLPPAPDEREWGVIPWSAGGTRMHRHQSLLDLGELSDYLARSAPRHVYFSSARFADPGAATMDDKGWREADLVFDIDADHLPGVDPETTGYADMLEAGKQALLDLLDLLEDDFDFDEMQAVFSGGRGYHVHVRDESIRGLDSEARREVVDYIRAIDLDFDALIETRQHGTTTQRVLRAEGGWGRRTHRRLLDFVDGLMDMEEEAALERLKELDGIGDGRAKTILGAFRNNPDAIREGNVEAGGPGVRTLVESLARETVEDETSPIDEPVTTDTKRLIRLPKSLHGGSGLVVEPLARDEIEAFDPLVDAVPDRFRGSEVSIKVTDPGEVTFDGDTFTLTSGVQSVRESLGVFLMTRGRAEKVTE
ncbi:DNA primase small subunit PriS [Haloferax mediterranei ATCC 33500]|uniref:DNA primase small subunit PriS n=1 Tax=Haloferax mediterranei (strain ATCC 33500 / DSM 1411 / JCM 8866 / NBRC 14739 / NCIMB 2177 / R-4) TaxID=523841 RepID=I3R828_HALMT|nr:DNA primase small subunit PriS [Haloferax mediterranei]AFK20388.1 DNA primase small subunit [Haloferax mediterranei ATCC 33500]AHZ23751.1 DNA primase [Haloferax mediterranei ATCC 33500]ELZ99243.1 DNA primase small subunit [Haloferax mediterranei ATCC 33500]MDX5986858.1 DNA primase small subunit PriS [Haloferax mediterranei ATCC 33500]QCQ76182.1 DNA primase small subunit PriS [Haloferax mediterranei ATCC 33500]